MTYVSTWGRGFSILSFLIGFTGWVRVIP